MGFKIWEIIYFIHVEINTILSNWKVAQWDGTTTMNLHSPSITLHLLYIISCHLASSNQECNARRTVYWLLSTENGELTERLIVFHVNQLTTDQGLQRETDTISYK